eukprot:1161897-Pelagomonas_calceolata.AAC.1
MVYRGATWLLSMAWQKLKRKDVRAVMRDSSCVAYGGRKPKCEAPKSRLRRLVRGTTRHCMETHGAWRRVTVSVKRGAAALHQDDCALLPLVLTSSSGFQLLTLQ